jgi:peptidoglycan hydrolase-like protein with peptidoglycan-binding domain
MSTGAMLAPIASAQTTTSKKTATKSSATHLSSSNTTFAKSGKSSGKKSSKTKKVKGQAEPTTERINEIQDALTKRGMFSGTPSGKWDESTVDAMKKFQAANHLNPTGKMDALTLQKLGFGSETAGLAAPTPPPNSGANRLLSRNTPRDAEPADNN